ncbi:glycosyltransferase [Peribacillus sp. NPDC097264]|uniref:glycosyltransferase n=1 Tax=Peribacillus sp. NPDC097264 TaxID=3390616 RepID=UPI003D059CA1
MSKVSVIVPIYNAEKQLNKCIKSILNQSFTDFELILVNDGSTDKSLEICNKYKERNENRIVVIDKKNEGSIPTRRIGLEKASSNYIMYVDADDWIEKRTIEILYNESTINNLDIAVCNKYNVLGKISVFKKKSEKKYFIGNKLYMEKDIKKDIVPAYFYGHPFPASLYAKMYKRDILLYSGKYLNRNIFFGDDLFYNLEIFLRAQRVKMINKPLYYYRVGGFTSKYMPYLFDDMVNGYEIFKEVINEYYLETKQQQYNGISIMLLNTLKTCLYNLVNSNLTELEIKNSINNYINNKSILEAINNPGVINYFPAEYLISIKEHDIDYLYNIGMEIYKDRKLKNKLIIILRKVSLL